MVRFSLSQLKSNRKRGFHNKLPTGSQWKVTHIGQKTDSSPENDVNKLGVSKDSEFEDNVEEVDYLDSYESYSPSDDFKGTQILLYF